MKGFLQEIMKKKIICTWNIRRLVDDSFVLLDKQPSVFYCKLTDFMSQIEKLSEIKPPLVCNLSKSVDMDLHWYSLLHFPGIL